MTDLGKIIDYLIKNLSYRNGLHIFGAGTSSGLVPFGKELINKKCYDFLTRGHFDAEIPTHDSRTKWFINNFSKGFESYNYRYFVPMPDGSTMYKPIFDELLIRMPPAWIQSSLIHELAKKLFQIINNIEIDISGLASYLIFQKFYRSIIINYNLDGLAEFYLRKFHHIISPHRIINPNAGSEDFKKNVVEFDRFFGIDALEIEGMILIEQEKEKHKISEKLRPICNYNYDFVLLIGYTFGRQSDGSFDDKHSFEIICQDIKWKKTFYNNQRKSLPIFVIDPYPEIITAILKEEIKSNDIYAVPIYWNKFSISLLKKSNRYDLNNKKLFRDYLHLLDSNERNLSSE